VGSGAFTLGVASLGGARFFSLGDTLAPLVGIWSHLIEAPIPLCDAYEALWRAQAEDPRAFYDEVRARFHREQQPAQLLFLLARCVKNAVRFNAAGHFNQSPDRRRLGVRPERLRPRILLAHALLTDRALARREDYGEALARAKPGDLLYLDPPYVGVSGGRDRRYHAPLDLGRFVRALAEANARGLSFLVSLDGHRGERVYGPGLPETLGCARVELSAGPSSQATLHGRREETFESLYLSPALLDRLREAGRWLD
jgi:DNA adenine methylase